MSLLEGYPSNLAPSGSKGFGAAKKAEKLIVGLCLPSPPKMYSESDRTQDRVSILVRILEDGNEKDRLGAVAQLSGIGEPAVPLLVEALENAKADNYGEGRLKFLVQALGLISSPLAIPALSKKLDRAAGHEKHAGVIADALGKIGTDDALAAVFEHLPSLDGAGWAKVVSRFGDSGINEIFRSFELEDAERVRVAALVAGELKLTRAVPHLVKLLESNDLEAVETAIVSLGKIGEAAAVPPLMFLLSTWMKLPKKNQYERDPMMPLRSKALQSLIQIRDPSVVAELLSYAVTGDKMCEAAVVLLGESAVPPLLGIVQTGERESQKLASKLIMAIKGGPQESTYWQQLTQPDRYF